MALKWKFWEKSQGEKKSPDNHAPEQDQQEAQQPEGDSPDQNNPQDGKNGGQNEGKGKLTHAFIDNEIEQIVAGTKQKMAPAIAEIQRVCGEIAAVQEWYSNPKNLTDLVLKYAKMHSRPTRKEVLFSDILTEGSSPDMTEGLNYNRHLDEFVTENRPEAGFLTRMKKSSLDAKVAFKTKLAAIAESTIMDAEQRRETVLDELLKEKQNGLDKIHRLYDFYMQIEDALNKGDIDSMLDISNGHIDDAVTRILDVNLSQMHDFKEARILIRQIGVYDKLVAAAANAPTAQDGLEIITKVTGKAKSELDVLAFVEDAVKATKSGDIALAYTDFMQSYSGDFIPMGEQSFVNARHIIDAHYDDAQKTINWRSMGGQYGLANHAQPIKGKGKADALIRILSARPEFVESGNDGSGFNASFLNEVEHGYYNPHSHSGPGRTKEDLLAREDYAELVFAQTVEQGKVLRAVVDQNGITEFEASADTDFENFVAEVEALGFLEKHKGLPLLRTQDIQFIRYDYAHGALCWSVSGTQQGHEWHRYEVNADDAKAFLANLTKRAQFVTCPDGWTVNLDQVQTIEYGDIPLETLEALAEIEADNEAETEAENDEEVEITPRKGLCINTATGENGFGEWFDLNVSEKDALSFIKQCAAYKSFAKIDERFALNTGQLYHAYVTHLEIEDYDDEGNVTNTEIKPHLVFGLYGRENDFAQMQYELTEPRLTTVIGDIAKAGKDSFVVNSAEKYPAYVLMPEHIVKVTTLDSGKTKDGNVDIEFAGVSHGTSSWTLPFEDKDYKRLFETLGAIPHMQTLANGILVSRTHTLKVDVTADSTGLVWTFTGGSRGTYRKDITNLSPKDVQEAITSLRNFGRENLADRTDRYDQKFATQRAARKKSAVQASAMQAAPKPTPA